MREYADHADFLKRNMPKQIAPCDNDNVQSYDQEKSKLNSSINSVYLRQNFLYSEE